MALAVVWTNNKTLAAVFGERWWWLELGVEPWRWWGVVEFGLCFATVCSRARERKKSRMSQGFDLSNWADGGAIYWGRLKKEWGWRGVRLHSGHPELPAVLTHPVRWGETAGPPICSIGKESELETNLGVIGIWMVFQVFALVCMITILAYGEYIHGKEKVAKDYAGWSQKCLRKEKMGQGICC